MMTKTCLIFEASPILAGIATGLLHGLPPPADKMFCARSQWLFWKTCFVIASRVQRLGTGTILTTPRSWWVFRLAGEPCEVVVEFSGGVLWKPAVPMPLSLPTSSALSAVSSTTELGA